MSVCAEPSGTGSGSGRVRLSCDDPMTVPDPTHTLAGACKSQGAQFIVTNDKYNRDTAENACVRSKGVLFTT